MTLARRIDRLEKMKGPSGQVTFWESVEQYDRLLTWLAERGYADCLAALEAGESGPKGLQEMLSKQAAYDPKRRAFARIEAALKAHQLPDDADVRLMADDAVK